MLNWNQQLFNYFFFHKTVNQKSRHWLKSAGALDWTYPISAGLAHNYGQWSAHQNVATGQVQYEAINLQLPTSLPLMITVSPPAFSVQWNWVIYSDKTQKDQICLSAATSSRLKEKSLEWLQKWMWRIDTDKDADITIPDKHYTAWNIKFFKR